MAVETTECLLMGMCSQLFGFVVRWQGHARVARPLPSRQDFVRMTTPTFRSSVWLKELGSWGSGLLGAVHPIRYLSCQSVVVDSRPTIVRYIQ